MLDEAFFLCKVTDLVLSVFCILITDYVLTKDDILCIHEKVESPADVFDVICKRKTKS